MNVQFGQFYMPEQGSLFHWLFGFFPYSLKDETILI